jgi:hypothetical protein
MLGIFVYVCVCVGGGGAETKYPKEGNNFLDLQVQSSHSIVTWLHVDF